MPALLSAERPVQDQLAIGELQRDVCQGVHGSADGLAALRLVPVPDVGPPFDGELLAGASADVAAGPIPLGHGFFDGWACHTTETGAATAECEQAGRAEGTGACPGDLIASSAEIRRVEGPGEWPRQFARLLAEALAGARPVRQILPWTSDRARGHLHRLMPLFGGGQRPRVMRVIATRPTREVIEMTVIVKLGTRTRALAIRLEHMAAPRHIPAPSAPAALRWVCTAIEAA
jgi:Family of unknown function (DUF6459)